MVLTVERAGAQWTCGNRSRQQIVDEAPDLDEIVIEGLEDAGFERAALAAG
jgi:hypothetical protein